MARVRIDINQAAVNGLVTNPQSPVYRHMVRVGATCSAVAKVNAPVDTGRLRQAIDFEMIPRPPVLIARILATVNYAAVVHQGHGVILPRRAKALHWRSRGRDVFAARVGPVAGRPFLIGAVRTVTGKTPRLGG